MCVCVCLITEKLRTDKSETNVFQIKFYSYIIVFTSLQLFPILQNIYYNSEIVCCLFLSDADSKRRYEEVNFFTGMITLVKSVPDEVRLNIENATKIIQ